MGELGGSEAHEHALIGQLAADQGFSHLLLLPHPAQGHTAAAWRAARPEAPVIELADTTALRQAMRRLTQPGDTVLLKGAARQELASAAGASMELPSPIPLAPVAFTGVGVETCPMSTCGISGAVGHRYSAKVPETKLPARSCTSSS